MSIDFSPFYRNTVGFDRMLSLLDSALRTEPTSSGGYPPYNIEVTDENRYAITLAVAGFARDEIEIEVEKNVLSVRGKKAEDDKSRQYLYQGIASRSFERKFNLADHVEVTGADLNNGLLTIGVVKHIPEEMRPKRIEIGTGQVLEHKSQKDTKAA